MSIWAILWLALLIVIFIGTYLANKHTPKPADCKDLSECKGCLNIACSNYKEDKKDGH